MNKEIAAMFKALADENRLKIFELLIEGETCGCTLIDKLPITQPTMSYHLKTLTDAGMTTSIKEGTWKKHHVAMDKIDLLIQYLVNLKNIQSECLMNG